MAAHFPFNVFTQQLSVLGLHLNWAY